MQFSNALIALVAAGLASAQIPDVPSCSLNCFTTALTTDGCSGLTDFECHCGKPQLVSQVTPCVEKACPIEDQSSVSSVVVSICSAAGVPIEVPQPGGGEQPTSAPEPTATEPATTGEPTETAPAPTYGTGSSSSAAPSSSATPSGSTTPSGSASPSAPTFTGAASKNNIGGVAALAMAAAYYL